MHLLFVVNDAYIPHVATTLASIFENNKNMQFVVHIMATDISEINHIRLKQFISSYNHKLDIKLINPENLEIDLSVCGKWGIFPSLKLYAADLFPDVDRILYIDADMICLGRINDIEKIDMANYYIAAVTDEQGSESHKIRLNLSTNDFYCCAGLIWFNLTKWRKENIRQKCFEYFNNPQNKDIIKYGEQDVLNKVCQGHIYELPITYNMFNYYWLYHKRNIPQRYKAQIENYKKNTIIIHFIDACKPWFKDCLDPKKKLYWKYHSRTPWYHEKYGYSTAYNGYISLTKEKIKILLHKLGIKIYDYTFDK